MTEDLKPQIWQITMLKPQPGDLIVVKYPMDVDSDHFCALAEWFRDTWPGARMIAVGPAFDVSLLTIDELRKRGIHV